MGITITDILNDYTIATKFLNIITEFFAKELHTNQEPLMYCINNRGFSTKSLEDFKIGYHGSSTQLMNYCKELDLSEQLFFETELFKQGVEEDYTIDRFVDRIIFPVIDLNSNTIGFSGRVWKEEVKKGKFINSPTSKYFKKRLSLYGLNNAWQTIKQKDWVLIVEGVPDVVSAHQFGITNTVAPCGTSLTDEQILLLKYFTNNFMLCFDNDEGGKKATLRSTKLLNSHKVDFNILELPGCKDLDEFLRKYGVSPINKALESMD